MPRKRSDMGNTPRRRRPKRPKDPAQLAVMIGRMATGEIPNDKAEVLDTDSARKGKPARTPTR